MAQPASQGGCSAERADVDEILASRLEHFDAEAGPQAVTLEHMVQATADMKDIKKTLMKAPLGKAVPSWSVPGEVWRLALITDRVAKPTQRRG
eukprot:13368969-Heterocapsa_arctica.AAC.1